MLQLLERIAAQNKHQERKRRARPQPRNGQSLHLPPELITCILQNLPGTARSEEDHADSTSRAIASACLVCWAWYSFGTPLLYHHPMVNTRTLPLLARTLAKCPPLCALIRGLHVEQHTTIQGNAHYIDWFTPRKRKQSQDNFLAHLFRILHLSPSLESLSASFVFYNRPRLPMDIKTGPWVTSRLRFLSVSSRDTLDFVFTNLAFPLLEVLCLINPTLDKVLELHPQPRVHTLCIRQSFCSPESSNLDIANLRRLFPNLRTFEFFGCLGNLYRPISPRKDTPHLDQLCFMEAYGVLRPDSWKNYLSTVKARELTLGVLREYNEPLATWQIPRSIESLTLVVKLVDLYDVAPVPSVQPLKYVLQLLRNNARDVGTSPLQRLQIWIERSFEEDLMVEGLEYALDAIKDFCRSRRIGVEVKDVCERTSRFVISTEILIATVAIHQWIVDRMDPRKFSGLTGKNGR